MKSHLGTHIKRILMGLLIVKLGVTLAVWIDATHLKQFFSGDTVTVAQAQESVLPPEAETAARDMAPAGNKTDPDMHFVLQSLEAKRLEIQRQEEALNAKQQQLENLKHEIETRVEELSLLQKKIEDALVKKEAQDAAEKQKKMDAEKAKINQLVKVYASMKPKSAGPIIDKLDLDVAYKIFMYMKGEQAGKILSYVNRDRAAKISERLASHRSN